MIGTIRKHSGLLWWSIIPLTIISFVWFMGSGPVHNERGGSGNPYGTIYGRPVKPLEYLQAQNEFYIFYWLHYGQWPEKRAGLTKDDIDRETFIRLLLQQKAAKLDIKVGADSLVTAAAEFLRSVGRNGQSVPMAQFVAQNLAPQGLSAADLQNFLHDELVVQQLIQTLGLSGALVTPQEAGLLYDRENQEVSAQAVLFVASNYLAKVSTPPAAVAQFYTNNLAAYRVPDRITVNYVAFEVTNYLAASKAAWEKTNFPAYVDSVYAQYGLSEFPEAKTPEEAKTKIRELLIRNRALGDARQAANEFATALFAQEPVKAGNLATLAKQKGLTVQTTAPFSAAAGPENFNAPAAFAKAAFQLSADVPFGGPIVGADGVYVIGLANQLPSTIPPLDQIQADVVRDLRAQEAVTLARHAGTNFYSSLTVQMTAGKTFAQAAVAAAQTPLVLPPFSLSTAELAETAEHADIRQIKQAAFTTPPGHVSNFEPTADGGFVLFVQQMLPIDEAKKTAAMPQFLGQVRRARQNEAFNVWLQGEANRELRDTPFYQNKSAGAAKQL